MTTPYYSDESVTLWHGDALAVLREMPAESVDCVVTSPPYFGLRDYGVEGQQGAESSPAEYVAGMVAVFAEVRRVLAADGTCWLNLGDSYAANRSYQVSQSKHAALDYGKSNATKVPDGMKAKDLMGVPWMTALALRADGWWLRSEIIWSKPNAMPESVTDRVSGKHEHLFMLTRSDRYWFDLEPIKVEVVKGSAGSKFDTGKTAAHQLRRASTAPRADADLRNPGDVWTLPTQPFAEAHFATMPVALAERCVLAGCKPGGTVLDPYSGSGTSGLAATKHGRRYVGIDLNAEYLDLSLRTRLAQTALIEEPA